MARRPEQRRRIEEIGIKNAADIKLPLQAFGLTEGSDDGGGVLALGIDGIVEAADVGGGKFAAEIG